MAELTVKDVALRLGDNEILKGVSVAVPAGEVVALLGPSGSGKTTLLRAIAGLETPYRGSIGIGDHVFFDAARDVELPAEERGLGLVFQSYALWPHRTVFENVAYGLKLRGVSTAEIKARVEKTLSQIGLAHLAARYPHQLSGGQQQRVAIARALVYEPPVILLDEPLSNLDAKLREEARAWLRTLIVTLGLSAIHVTHDQVEAMAIADRIVLLDAGVIAQEGSPTTLYNEPATLFAAEFMGSNNRLDGKLLENSGGRATIELFGERLSGVARTKAAAGEKATGIVRIERVRCASSPGANRLKMELKAPMYLGERWELVLARENVTVRAYASAPLEPGEHYVEFPPEALWVF
ncbi:MAG TPA: ABC transporter ATP-binding protein [Pseudolabrys sp.]|jgi:iron(III) transport system ATP-binding protein